MSLMTNVDLVGDEIPGDLPFEKALEQLEKIVAELERGQPSLSTALSRYESGLRLLNHCHSTLDRAERSVAILHGVDEEGNPLGGPFDALATDLRKS